jgi:hypothetical protein
MYNFSNIISLNQIFWSFLVPFVGTTAFFIIVMLILRSLNFEKNGARKNNKNLDDSDRKKQIETYNNSVHKVSEFYVKMMLALLGGMSILAINIKESNAILIKYLITFSGMFFFVVTIFFCIMLIINQRGKIMRWQKRYVFLAPLSWAECWIANTAFAISYFVNFELTKKMVELMG